MAVRAVDDAERPEGAAADTGDGSVTRVSRRRLRALIVGVAAALAIVGVVASQRGGRAPAGGRGALTGSSAARLRALDRRVAAAAPRLRAEGIQLISWSPGISTDGREHLRVRAITPAQERRLDRLFGEQDIRVVDVRADGS